jgi:2'-5' RNA ligase
MAHSPYLVEVRLMGGLKKYLKAIAYDIADEFGVQSAVDPRPVPHITLFGPYDTDRGTEARTAVRDVCSRFGLVPFRLNGFGHFRNDVIYVDIELSPELRQLRRQLAARLRPVCTQFQPYDVSKHYRFHITVAKNDIEREFGDIWSYVTDEFAPGGEQYALRVTTLRGRRILHEYDLLQDRLLSREEALSTGILSRTKDRLAERRSPNDHETCRSLSTLERVRHELEIQLFG